MSRPTRRTPIRRRLRNAALLLTTTSMLVAVNGPTVATVADTALTTYQVNQPDYKAKYGHWETVELPEGYRIRTVHAAMLYTGKVLLIAGSGNSQTHFDAGTFDTVVWDPATGKTTKVDTPEDLWCGGHAYLPNGNLLVAGGTRKYEILADKVKRAAGVLSVKSEADTGAIQIPKGTRFTGKTGKVYVATEEVRLPPAHKMADNSMMAGSVDVWVEAAEEGEDYVVDGGTQFAVAGIRPEIANNVYAIGDTISLQKQNYRGLDASYEFDVQTEKYIPTGRLTESRWYPTLVGINGGNVLAVSGLDQHGVIINGKNEMYELSQRAWFDQENLARYFPTYPSLFRLKDGRLFYSGSSTGYGSATDGRQPGIWNLADNSWVDIDGLRDPQMTETSTSFLLPPVQEQKVAVVGGGDVGDKPTSTARFDVVDLDSENPRFEAGQDYPSPARYLNAVTLPTDKVLLTGGSKGYRGAGASDLHLSRLYDAKTGKLEKAADNNIGRNYHSTALLLPDGRVLTMGSDPLFSDRDNKAPGVFETRMEIYSPPYLFAETQRPVITAVPDAPVQRGTTFRTQVRGGDIAEARMIRPSAVTHVTDAEQRSVELAITPVVGGAPGMVDLTLDEAEGITPSGWYLLVLIDANGVPSEGSWVQVL